MAHSFASRSISLLKENVQSFFADDAPREASAAVAEDSEGICNAKQRRMLKAMSVVQMLFLVAFARIAMLNGTRADVLAQEFVQLPSSLVLELTDENLQGHIAKHTEGTLVHFHVSGCSYCEALAPELSSAAQTLLSRGITTPIVAADAALTRATLQRYGVTKFPMLMWFRNGKMVREVPHASRSAAKIIEFVEWASQPSVIEFGSPAVFAESLPQLRAVLKSSAPPVIVGFEGSEPWLRNALEVVGERFRGETAFLIVSQGPSNGVGNNSMSNSTAGVLRAVHREAWKDEEFAGSQDSRAVAVWVENLLAKKRRPSKHVSPMLVEI